MTGVSQRLCVTGEPGASPGVGVVQPGARTSGGEGVAV